MIKVAFLMIVVVLVALLFNQLPDYLGVTYANYIVLAIVAMFGALIFISSNHK